uniref:ParB-like N-terminal domain-containing protein n=1 Tax=viral metagenome TaxID=1070528 RepID=A0A6M3LXF1_9ZZZZ
MVMIPLEKIRISDSNMRINEPFGNEKEDQELIENIKSQGVIQPITVRQIGDIYAVDIGRRRFLAAKAAGFEEIPCIVTEMTDDEAMDASFSENIIRKDADPVTRGRWIVGKQERSGMSLRELGRELGISFSTLSKDRAMTTLTEEMQHEVQRDAVSRINALKILRMDLTPDEERTLAEESRSGGSKAFNKALDRMAEDHEKRGAPTGLKIIRISWGFESSEYEVLKRRAKEADIELGEYCQRVLKDHLKEL